MTFAGDAAPEGLAKSGERMAEARALASVPRRRLRRPERGARINSATSARFIDSDGSRGSGVTAGEFN